MAGDGHGAASRAMDALHAATADAADDATGDAANVHVCSKAGSASSSAQQPDAP